MATASPARVYCEVCRFEVLQGDAMVAAHLSPQLDAEDAIDESPCLLCATRKSGMLAHAECCDGHCAFCGRAAFELENVDATTDMRTPGPGSIETCQQCKALVCIGDNKHCIRPYLRDGVVMLTHHSRSTTCPSCTRAFCTTCVLQDSTCAFCKAALPM